MENTESQPANPEKPNKPKTRNTGDDLIRIIAIIFVIMIHADNKPWTGIPVLDAVCTTIIFFCNSFFFLLSGKYNLRQEFDSPEKYSVYYRKKVVEIIFPYLAVSVLLSLWNVFVNPDPDITASSGKVYFLKLAFKEFFSSNASIHFWFMFSLVGFLLSAPFLSKMLHAMSNKELNILMSAAILWNVVTVFCFTDFYKPFAYTGWIFAGWIVHFVMGYVLYRIESDTARKRLCIAGIVGFVINVVGMTFFPKRFFFPTDLAPSFILACAGAYILLSRIINIKKERACRIISYAAKHTFMIYMIHFHLLHYITPHITGSLPVQIRFAADVIVTLAMSFAASVILNAIFDLCRKPLRKMLRII